MKKSDILDTKWYEYLKWCAIMPEQPQELMYWLNYKHPTEDNFWAWFTEINKSKV